MTLTHLITAILTTIALLILFGLICYAKGRYDQQLDDKAEAELTVKPWHKVNGNGASKKMLESGWEFKPKVLEKKEAA